MFRLALLFLMIALVAFIFGFGLVANLAYDLAKVVFALFLLLGAITLIVGSREKTLSDF